MMKRIREFLHRLVLEDDGFHWIIEQSGMTTHRRPLLVWRCPHCRRFGIGFGWTGWNRLIRTCRT